MSVRIGIQRNREKVKRRESFRGRENIAPRGGPRQRPAFCEKNARDSRKRLFLFLFLPSEEGAEQAGVLGLGGGSGSNGGAAENGDHVAQIQAVAEIDLAGLAAGSCGENAEQNGGDAAEGGADLLLAQAALVGQREEIRFLVLAEDVADDLVAVVRVGLFDLLLDGLLAGVLGQRAEQGNGTFLFGGVAGEHLEQQGKGQGQELFEILLAQAGLRGQRLERAVGEQGLENNSE